MISQLFTAKEKSRAKGFIRILPRQDMSHEKTKITQFLCFKVLRQKFIVALISEDGPLETYIK